jgi:ribonuclease Z
MHIYGPKGIKEFVEMQLKISQSHVKFELIFHELTSKKSELIFEDAKVEVYTIPLKHRIYTNGYLFREKLRPRNLNIEAIKQIDEIEICDYNNLKAGRDFTLSNGDVIKNEDLTFDPPKPLSYAFCSDTIYKPDIVEVIKESSLLYHESTFLSDREDLAIKTKHSTAKQAAQIAKAANVGKLILGHYSSRYNNTELFRVEAQQVFDAVDLADAGKKFSIGS